MREEKVLRMLLFPKARGDTTLWPEAKTFLGVPLSSKDVENAGRLFRPRELRLVHIPSTKEILNVCSRLRILRMKC